MSKSTHPSLPVEFGDTWTLNDIHHFHNADMLNFKPERKYDIVYTDPPWNMGILKQFYDRAGQPLPPSFMDFLIPRFRKIGECCPMGPVFIEFGLKTWPDCITAMNTAGATLVAEADCTYTTNHIGMKIGVFCFNMIQRMDIPPGLHEWGIAETLLERYTKPGMHMLEPFCGEGYQSRIGIKNGLILTGIEIIPSKFEHIIHMTKGEWQCQRPK